MKRARIACDGAIREAVQDGGRLRLPDGRRVGEHEVVWLPPVDPGTAFALGLNYADHAKELAFKAPDKPLVFLKGRNTFTGHRARTRRPADAAFMHYECELAV
ncbi:MAG TPA: fumarylacetoacetate hydrolase family protein, partial [Rhodocyclaceae bacterium]|nr:fumarylacetoacetate hydrolase family protein [Rhodocyclaceae bacterium]